MDREADGFYHHHFVSIDEDFEIVRGVDLRRWRKCEAVVETLGSTIGWVCAVLGLMLLGFLGELIKIGYSWAIGSYADLFPVGNWRTDFLLAVVGGLAVIGAFTVIMVSPTWWESFRSDIHRRSRVSM